MSQVVHMSATSKAEPYFEAHHQPLSMPKLLAEDNPTESPQVALDTCRLLIALLEDKKLFINWSEELGQVIKPLIDPILEQQL